MGRSARGDAQIGEACCAARQSERGAVRARATTAPTCVRPSGVPQPHVYVSLGTWANSTAQSSRASSIFIRVRGSPFGGEAMLTIVLEQRTWEECVALNHALNGSLA